MPNLDGGTFRSGSHNGPVAEGTFSFGLLLPNTEYEVKIRAKNKYGWSEEEPFFVFKTSRLGKYFHGFFSNSFFFSFFPPKFKNIVLFKLFPHFILTENVHSMETQCSSGLVSHRKMCKV